MPGNIVKINNSEKLEWYIGDSNMEKLIGYLDKVGLRLDDMRVYDIGQKEGRRRV